MPVLRLCLALLPAATLVSSSGTAPLVSTREACMALVKAAAEKQDAEIALMCRSRMDQNECSTVIDSLGERPWSSSARDSTCERHEDMLARRFLLQLSSPATSSLDNSTQSKSANTVPVSTTTRRISYDNEVKTPPATLNQLGNELPTSEKSINDVDKVIMRNTPAEGGTIEPAAPPSTAEETTTPKPVATTQEITTPKPVTTAEEITTPEPATAAPTTPMPATTEEITSPMPTTEEITTLKPTTEEPTTTATTGVDLQSIPDQLESAPATLPLGAASSAAPAPPGPSSASVEAINSAASAQAKASSGGGWDDFMSGPSPPPAQTSGKSSQPSASDEVTGDSSAAASTATQSSSSSSAEAETPAAESSPAASTDEKNSGAEAGSATATSSDAESSAADSSDSEAAASFGSFVSGQEKFQRQEALRQKESARQNTKSRLTSAVVVVSLVAGISAFALRSRWVDGPRIMSSSSSSSSCRPYSRIDQLAPTSESRELQLTSALRMDDIESAVE